jgi:hypothetical protein
MSPSVTYPGQKVNIYVNPMEAPNYQSKNDLPIHIKLDGTRLDTTEYMDVGDKLDKGTLQYVRGTVQSRARNSNADLSVWFRGAGSALKNTASADTCNLDGSCYSVRIMPTVDSVSASAGYTTGGQDITVTGTSLDGNVDVTVGGVPCEISSVSESSVTCQTTETALDGNAQTAYVGQHGLRHYI